MSVSYKECKQCSKQYLENYSDAIEHLGNGQVEGLLIAASEYVENSPSDYCFQCLHDIYSKGRAEEKRASKNLNEIDDDFWEENNQWPGLDPSDYLGG